MKPGVSALQMDNVVRDDDDYRDQSYGCTYSCSFFCKAPPAKHCVPIILTSWGVVVSVGRFIDSNSNILMLTALGIVSGLAAGALWGACKTQEGTLEPRRSMSL
jgi:hypothetical protein